MKAVLKSYSISDSEDFSSYENDGPQLFRFKLILRIGAADSEGEDFFEVIVASPAYLAQYYSGRTPIFLRHTLLVSDYDVQAVVTHIRKYLSSLEEDSWYKLAAKINRVARWKYEDYRP